MQRQDSFHSKQEGETARKGTENMKSTESGKLDRRQQKTREAIFQALAKLLQKKSFSNITVQEIIDEANVGRTTFYAHFETKDHLLKAMCESIFDHVLTEHLEKEDTHDFSGKTKDLPEMLEHILYHLQDEKEEILEILLTESGDLFLHYFSDGIRTMLEKNKKTLPKVSKGLPKDYQIEMLTSGIVETVRWWVGHRMKYTPEQMAGYFKEIYLK